MTTKNLKIIIFILILLTFATVGIFYKLNCDNDAKRLYKQGMGFFVEKKYQDAYYNFKQIKKFSNLYRLSLLKQFQCADRLSDKKTAALKLSELSRLEKDPNLRPYILYNETLLAKELNTESTTQSYRKFKYINENYPESDFGAASAFKLGEILETKNKPHAQEKYIEYLNYAPSGKFSLQALENLSSLNVSISPDAYEIIGFAYLSNQNFKEALKAYNMTPFSKNWYYISKCYRGLKDYESEKNTILKGLGLSVSAIDEKDLSNAIDRLISITKSDKIQTLQALYSGYRNSYILPTVSYKLAENSTSIRAIKLYELVVNEYPASIWASNALWEVFWYNYKLSRYKICERLALKHSELYSNTQDAPRVAYWYGRVLLNERKTQQAKEAFYNVINNYPLSYYSFLSARQLKMSKAKKMILKKPILAYDINSINKFLFKDKTLLKLAQYNDYETIDDLKINNEFINSWVLNKKEIYPKSITTAKNKFNEKISQKETEESEQADESEKVKIKFSDYELKLMYPVLFEDIINNHAKEFKQSPYLFLSLVREESHFDKTAKSAVGALGLSQIMMPTANFIEKAPVSSETLLNPNENIRIGLKYFTYLVDYFNKDEFLAILAYNAGPGNINKWKTNPSIASDEIDVFVENIPYLETKNYIKKILSTYWVYLNIYSPKNR